MCVCSKYREKESVNELNLAVLVWWWGNFHRVEIIGGGLAAAAAASPTVKVDLCGSA